MSNPNRPHKHHGAFKPRYRKSASFSAPSQPSCEDVEAMSMENIFSNIVTTILIVSLLFIIFYFQFCAEKRQTSVVLSKPMPPMLQLRDGCFYRQDSSDGKLYKEASLECLSQRELKSITRADVSLTTASKIHEARQLYTDRVELFELMK